MNWWRRRRQAKFQELQGWQALYLGQFQQTLELAKAALVLIENPALITEESRRELTILVMELENALEYAELMSDD